MEKYYGFIRVNPNPEQTKRAAQDDGVGGAGAVTVFVYDLKGFLAEMENEGRPSPELP